MKKGVVLEIKKSCIILLTPEGEFVKGQKKGINAEVGEEIIFRPIQEMRSSSRKRSIPKWMAAAAMAAVLLITVALGSPFMAPDKAYAYVSFDINPSIELTLDKKYKIIGAKGYNADGEAVLSRLENISRKDFKEAAAEIIAQFKAMGYFSKQGELVVAAVMADGGSSSGLEELTEEIDTLKPLTEETDIELSQVEATMEERNKALEKGLTVGMLVAAEQKRAENKMNNEAPAQGLEKAGDNINKGNEGQGQNQSKAIPSEELPINPNSLQKEIMGNKAIKEKREEEKIEWKKQQELRKAEEKRLHEREKAEQKRRQELQKEEQKRLQEIKRDEHKRQQEKEKEERKKQHEIEKAEREKEKEQRKQDKDRAKEDKKNQQNKP
ncbi:MAG TPA: anti-sigma factor domain-containing protein [Bacillaceae bacterium]